MQHSRAFFSYNIIQRQGGGKGAHNSKDTKGGIAEGKKPQKNSQRIDDEKAAGMGNPPIVMGADGQNIHPAAGAAPQEGNGAACPNQKPPKEGSQKDGDFREGDKGKKSDPCRVEEG